MPMLRQLRNGSRFGLAFSEGGDVRFGSKADIDLQVR
jgi:hypothetical protein